LSAYLDGELSEAEAAEVARAVEADKALAAELASLRRVRELVGSLPRASAPDDLAERVLDRVERGRLLDGGSDEPARAGRPWVGWFATAAVMVVAVGAGVILTWKLSTPSFSEIHGNAGAGRVAEARKRSPSDLPAGPTDGGLAIANGTSDSGSTSARRGGRWRLGKIGGYDLKGLDGDYRPGPAIRQFYMNTDNLVLAKADVERVLESNGIVPEDRAGARGRRAGARGSLRANVYNRKTAAGDRVEYEVAVKPEQMREVFRQLNSIRRAQNVPQFPIVSALDEAPPKDDSAMTDALEDIARTLADMEDRPEGRHVAPDVAAKPGDLPKAAGEEKEASARTPRASKVQGGAAKDMADKLRPDGPEPAAPGSGEAGHAWEAVAEARDRNGRVPATRPSPVAKIGEASTTSPDVTVAGVPGPAPARLPARGPEALDRRGDGLGATRVDQPAERQGSPATELFLSHAGDRVAEEIKKRHKAAEAASHPALADEPGQTLAHAHPGGAAVFEGLNRPATTAPASAPTTQPLDVLTGPALPAAQGQWGQDARLLRLRIILNEARSK